VAATGLLLDAAAHFDRRTGFNERVRESIPMHGNEDDSPRFGRGIRP
jgi:hypothetical protein